MIQGFVLLILFPFFCFALPDVTVTSLYVDRGTHHESVLRVEWTLQGPETDIHSYYVTWEARSEAGTIETSELIPNWRDTLEYQYQVENIVQGDCYDVIVYALDFYSKAQQIETNTIQARSPVPHNLTFAVNGDDATVTWKITGDFIVNSYNIYIFHSSSFETLGQYQPVTNDSPMTYTMTLLKGVLYDLVAVYANSQSPCGSSWQQMPGILYIHHLTAPETPVNVQASTPEGSNNPASELYVIWDSPLSLPWTQHIINIEAKLNSGDKYSYYSPTSTQNYLASGLEGSENYEVTVQAVNAYTGENLAGERSSPVYAITAPEGIGHLSLYELTNNNVGTGRIYIGFDKPQGGDAIDDYEITWYSETNPSIIGNSGLIKHTTGQTYYDYVTEVLPKGSTYWFSVVASNSSGKSTSMYTIYI